MLVGPPPAATHHEVRLAEPLRPGVAVLSRCPWGSGPTTLTPDGDNSELHGQSRFQLPVDAGGDAHAHGRFRSSGALPQGVRVLDSWQNERFGGVLFWIDMSLNFHGWGTAILHDAMLRHDRDGWRPMGGGGAPLGLPRSSPPRKGRDCTGLAPPPRTPVRLIEASPAPGCARSSCAASTAGRPVPWTRRVLPNRHHTQRSDRIRPGP